MHSGPQNQFRVTGALEAFVITVCLVLLATAGAGLLGAPVGVA